MTSAGVRRLLEDVGARAPSPGDPKIDGLSPALVLSPGDDDHCARALGLCHREDMAVVPLGAGTRIDIGNRPLRFDVYLSTEELVGVEEHIPGDLTVAVRAGTRLAELQEELGKANQFLPVDPPRPSEATVGGIFALGEPGLRRQPGARPRDLLLGLEAVLADGTKVRAGGRVVKNVAGYELTKLFVGPAGTLAVMTKAFLRSRALPESVESVGFPCRRPTEAARRWRAIRSLPFAPEVAAVSNPEHSARHGLDGFALLVRFEGLEEEVSAGLSSARERLASDGEAVPSELWSLIQDFPASAPEGTLVLRGQAAPARTLELVERWRDGGELVAFPDSGLVYSRTEDPEAFSERVAAAQTVGASVVVEKAPLDLKAEIDVFGEIPAGFDLMRGIKEKLDPKGILSPGRFVGRL